MYREGPVYREGLVYMEVLGEFTRGKDDREEGGYRAASLPSPTREKMGAGGGKIGRVFHSPTGEGGRREGENLCLSL